MENQRKNVLGIFDNDLMTLERIKDDSEYEKRLKAAFQIVKDWGALNNISSYTFYKYNTKSLQEFDFIEISFFERIKDNDYLADLKRHLECKNSTMDTPRMKK